MTDLLRTVKDTIKETPLWPIMRPRRIHAYNLGAGRTGTTTIAGIFSETFRAQHEAMASSTVRLLTRYKEGNLSENRVRDALRKRDRKRRLEFESSPFLGPFADHLVKAFPDAKFILTVRAPRAWLRSIIDRCINNPREELASHFRKLRDFCFGEPPTEYSEEESALANHPDLHSLEGYLGYWDWHNRKVLNGVPSDRLLILRTIDLNESIPKLSSFFEVEETAFSPPRRRNRSASRQHLLAEVGEEYVQHLISEQCGETIQQIKQRLRSQ
jgi:hypothetical protein